MSALFQAIFGDAIPTRTRSNTFSGPRASRSYAARVRWMIAGLLSLVALLSTALFLLFNEYGPPPQPTDGRVSLTPIAAPAAKSILIARQRIEAGARLEPAMFDLQEVNPSYLPEGAVFAAERDTVSGYYAKEIINTGYPISRNVLSSTQLAPDELFIPDGYRAIAIPIDEVSSVAYAIRPNSRVDVVLSYTDHGQPAVVTVVPTAKVLSIGGNPNPNGKMEGARSATLLVTPDDARKVELSKKLGTLSLVLAGQTEILTSTRDTSPTRSNDIFHDTPEPLPNAEPKSDGTMIVIDPRTGEPIIYHLWQNQWTRK